MSLFHMTPLTANATGFATGLLSSFLLNRDFTFRVKVPLWPGLPYFAVVVALGYVGNALILLVATQWFSINPYLAQLLAVATYAVLVFVGSERLVFKGAGHE